MLLFYKSEFRRKFNHNLVFCLTVVLTFFSCFKWTGAKEFCRAGNMTLLSIEDYGEDHLIFGYGKYNPGKKSLKKNGNRIITNLKIQYAYGLGLYYSDNWTSGKFSGKGKRRWEWATTRPCQPMKYTNWNTEEPSNSESASCVSLRFFYTDFYQWHWNNKPCNNLAGVICESIPKH